MTRSPVVFGYFALLLSAIALLLAVTHVFGGPFAPQVSAEVGIAEFLGNLKDAAMRKATGQPQPAPELVAWDIDRMINLAASVISALALVFALAGYIRREPVRLVGAAGMLALGALTFQLIIWYSTLMIGVLVLFIILYHCREMVESIFE